MRKYHVFAAAFVCGFIAAGAAYAADTATTVITLSGTAPSTCNIPTAPTAPSSSNMSLTAGGTAAANTVNVTNIFNTTTGALSGGNITLRFANVVCNYNAQIGLRTTNGNLTTAAATVVGGTFLTDIDYTAATSWGGAAVASLTANGTAGATTNTASGGANVGDLDLTITVAPSATPVYGGTYSDTLTLQVGAAL
jgi:hypothetical protein